MIDGRFGLILCFSPLHLGTKTLLVIIYVAVIAIEFGVLIEVASVTRDKQNGPDSWLSGLVAALHALFLNPSATVLQTAAIFPQLKQMSSRPDLGALSTNSLGCQALLFPVLAICWPLRICLNEGVRWPFQMNLVSWYQLIGWAPVNGLIFAVVQGIIWRRAICLEHEGWPGEAERLLQ